MKKIKYTRPKGRTFVDIFTYVMLIKLVMVCFFKSGDFPAGVLTLYGTVLTTFALTNGVMHYVNTKNGKQEEID